VAKYNALLRIQDELKINGTPYTYGGFEGFSTGSSAAPLSKQQS
jgi:enolase